MNKYSQEELGAMYELARLYFEMGYFAPAERIFNGLVAIDEQSTPARLGLGLVKLERGLYEDAMVQFRLALQGDVWAMQSKLALSFAYLAAGEVPRAKSMLSEVQKESAQGASFSSEQQKLVLALEARLS